MFEMLLLITDDLVYTVDYELQLVIESNHYLSHIVDPHNLNSPFTIIFRLINVNDTQLDQNMIVLHE